MWISLFICKIFDLFVIDKKEYSFNKIKHFIQLYFNRNLKLCIYYMEASEPMLVNSVDIRYGVNSFRLEGLQIN